MADLPEQIAEQIIQLAGPQASASYDLLVSTLRALGRDPDLHERVALEMIAVTGVGEPASLQLLLHELRTRYPSEDELHEVVERGKRKASLKVGRPFPRR